ncbi:hypothetical protein LJR078_000339 [Arthrobacter sp. LjRoot78]|uniref:hypothetical protein n=1 Tax=Arthrobacter sp. LjRoot78 TaxID=3342338 RepID=UPI003ECE5573
MDEITLDTSVAEQLQDLVISSEDVNGFLTELCELSAAALSRTLGRDVFLRRDTEPEPPPH